MNYANGFMWIDGNCPGTDQTPTWQTTKRHV